MKDFYNFMLLALSIVIAVFIVIYKTAPWIFIALYWTVNALKNGSNL